MRKGFAAFFVLLMHSSCWAGHFMPWYKIGGRTNPWSSLIDDDRCHIVVSCVANIVKTKRHWQIFRERTWDISERSVHTVDDACTWAWEFPIFCTGDSFISVLLRNMRRKMLIIQQLIVLVKTNYNTREQSGHPVPLSLKRILLEIPQFEEGSQTCSLS